ncbi:major facilitator superfamily domain-containing protein 6 [Caerostris darwini]|uniref:Major facilitator superfamily domain-containing protein 6 n=1 Tax=Caerostris darwini TaxID=1538125 RepID=A0AAV4TKB1_9ARAC|nr:major facilitator superfamily domain-containing protein 6 [Caerostris darwini]
MDSQEKELDNLEKENQELNSLEKENQEHDTLEKENQELDSFISVQPNSNKESHHSQKWWQIDKPLIRFKLHYFLLTGALGSVLPFIAVIARDRIKLSATSFATIMVFQQFLFVFTKPAIGYITDYFNKLKAVLCIVAIFQAVFLFLVLLLPAIPKEVVGSSNSTFLDLLSNTSSVHSFCETFENSKRTLIVSSNFSAEFVSKDLNYLHLNKMCHVFKAEQEYSITIPSECRTINSNSSVTTKILGQSADSIDPLFNSSMFQTEKSLKDFCAFLIDDCIICCNHKDCYYTPLADASQWVPPSNISDFVTYQFWICALVFVLLNACVNAIFTLSDTACCESIKKNGADFGKQRLWGAIGWGLLAPVGGILRDYTGDYIITFIIFGILSIVMLWNISKLDLVKPQFSKNILKNIGTIMKSSEFLCFEVGVLINGIGLGFIWFYLLWFLISIGGNRLLCGLTQTVQCFVGELPFMFFSGWILKKIGYFNITTLSLLSYCVRFFWYSVIKDPWLVLPIEWVHGITYGVFYTSVASYAKKSARPGTEATTQAVVFATYDGLGSGIGNIVAGLGFDYLGAQWTFFYSSIFFGCCAIISTCYTFLQRNKKKIELDENNLQ